MQYSAVGAFQDYVSVSWTQSNTSGNVSADSAIFINGLLTNIGNAAGTFSFQWGSSGGTTTLQASSYMTLERIA